MSLHALVWFFLGTALFCQSIIASPALAQSGAMSPEGDDMIWWARLFWVLGIVVLFGLLLLAAFLLKFYWLPKWKRGKM